MEQRLASLEASLAALERRVDGLASRLADAEDRLSDLPPVAIARASAPDASLAAAPRVATDAAGLLGLTGRSLIVLGGAYLLRALTEGGTLPALLGVGMGLLYAFACVLAGGRAAMGRRSADATFHAVVATLIAFPLTVEATVRFGFLGPVTSAASLAALSGPALGIAWYTRHQPIAWCVTLGALGSAVALIPMTTAVLPYAAFLLVLGLVTLWLGYDRDWTALRWPVALVANLAALGLVVRATSANPQDPPALVVTMLLALLGGYLASVAARTLLRGRNVIPFEVVQTTAALVIGVAGSVAVVRASGAPVAPLGLATLALGGIGYAVAFAFEDRWHGLGVNFYFYTSFALVCTLVGLDLVLGATGVALVTAALAVGTTWLGGRLGRLALTVHGAIYVARAALASGLALQAGTAYFGHAHHDALLPAATAIAVLAAVGVCALSAVPRPSEWCTGVRGAETLLAAWCGGGTAIAVAMWGMATLIRRPLGPDEIAITRTVVLSAAALVLTIAGRAGWLVGAGRLAYGVLLVTGAQLLFEDLREAGPALLVVAFAAYGASLILVPRLARRPAPSAAAGEGARG